jgi:hypothetical protein
MTRLASPSCRFFLNAMSLCLWAAATLAAAQPTQRRYLHEGFLPFDPAYYLCMFQITFSFGVER